MKKWVIFLGGLLLFSISGMAMKHTITTTSSMTFSPNTISANVGDTIEFVVWSGHTATQVSQSTWNSNQADPLSGGFDFSTGTNMYVLKSTDLGVIYYVCIPHVYMGMKGSIFVGSLSSTETPAQTVPQLNVFPSVLKENQTVSIEAPNTGSMTVKVYTMSGAQVKSLYVESSQVTLPVNFKKGLYLIRVVDAEGKNYIKRIIVQ